MVRHGDVSCRRHGITPAGGHWLHLHAVDISRSADGRWWALADRTQSPFGPGYALENRQIVSRAFPDLLGDPGVRALGGFFAALSENLFRHAPGSEAPPAVVLTPGAFNETYFEHAYRARQLGMLLAEGNSLTVRRHRRRRPVSFIGSRFGAGRVTSKAQKSSSGESVGQAELSSREETKGGCQESAPRCEAAAAVKFTGCN